MLERLLVAAALVALGLLVYRLFTARHRARATGALAAAPVPEAISAFEAAAPHPQTASVLYFRSEHCAPCLTQSHFLDQLAAQYGPRVMIRKIDADRERDAADRYGIFTVPTTLVVDAAGTVRHVNYGLADTRKLTSQVQPLVGA